jgi:hypothetical protein
MQRYIEQLIDDIRKNTWDIKPPHSLWSASEADPDDELELEDISFAEQSFYGTEEPIEQITGIATEQLPPRDKLNVEQQALLANVLEQLLQHFHFQLDFPEKFPAHLRYPFIRNFWTEEHVPLSFGITHIEFCDYEEENCPFPGYCSVCHEVAKQMEYDEAQIEGCNFKVDLNKLLPSKEEVEDFFRRRNNTREEKDN